MRPDSIPSGLSQSAGEILKINLLNPSYRMVNWLFYRELNPVGKGDYPLVLLTEEAVCRYWKTVVLESLFNKVVAFLKGDFNTGVFLWILRNF